MLTQQEHVELRKKIDHYDSEARRQFEQPNGWVVVPLQLRSTLPPDPTNEERSACEVYEFWHEKPDRYFCFVNEDHMEVTTWTGEKLGDVSFGCKYRDNFGGERIPVTVRAINGISYHGTYYCSAGDYARLKAYKRAR